MQCPDVDSGQAKTAVKKPKRDGDSRRVGLARAISKLGYCSRSRAVELIRVGRVRLNGSLRTDPETPVHLGHDHIEVDGVPTVASRKICLMMNKPRGVITTASDEKGRRTVYDNLGSQLPWAAPVGRLDKASEGLLLLTNDSEWAARIASPETHLDKTYHVQVDVVIQPRHLQALTDGVRASTGEILRANSAEVLRRGKRNTWLTIVLDEGKNRQIRRMLEGLGITVLRLVRVAIGPLELGDLAKGAHRALTAQEKQMLDRAILHAEK